MRVTVCRVGLTRAGSVQFWIHGGTAGGVRRCQVRGVPHSEPHVDRLRWRAGEGVCFTDQLLIMAVVVVLTLFLIMVVVLTTSYYCFCCCL